jgi:hypothetical protein
MTTIKAQCTTMRTVKVVKMTILLEDQLLSVDNSSLEVRNEVKYENSQGRLKMVDCFKSEACVGEAIILDEAR